jgi:ribosomal protein S27AE
VPTGTTFRTASQRRYILVREAREKLIIEDKSLAACPRCGGDLLVGHGVHLSRLDANRCYAMGPSKGVVILKRSDSLDVIRAEKRRNGGDFIMDAVSGGCVG